MEQTEHPEAKMLGCAVSDLVAEIQNKVQIPGGLNREEAIHIAVVLITTIRHCLNQQELDRLAAQIRASFKTNLSVVIEHAAPFEERLY